jgi:hypothetical protein
MGRGTGPILKIKRVDFHELSKQIGQKLEKRSEKHRAEEKERKRKANQSIKAYQQKNK